MSEFLAALLGAVIGGLFALIGAYWTHLWEIDRKENETKNNISAFILGIKTEIETLKGRFDASISQAILNLPQGVPFELYYPAEQNYFAVIDAQSHLLGGINDDELRNLIIQMYITIKGLIDTINFNNRILEKFQDTSSEDIRNSYRATLISTAGALQSLHQRCNEIYGNLIPKIREYLSQEQSTSSLKKRIEIILKW